MFKTFGMISKTFIGARNGCYVQNNLRLSFLPDVFTKEMIRRLALSERWQNLSLGVKMQLLIHEQN